MRTGIIAAKVGMTRIFDEKGDHIPVTILKMEEVQVVARKTQELHGYEALQVGYGHAKPSRLTKPMREYFAKRKIEPKKKLKEFRIAAENALEEGASLTVGHFAKGQYIDVAGITIGRGFTGAMKRWNFGGMRASHGVSISHRAHGSTGQCQDPGRVFKGKKMAGHYGSERVTIQNLKVVDLDEEKGLLLVKGAVPGHKGGYVYVRDAVKRSNLV